MKRLQLYCIFHLNLAYSSIDQHQHAAVLERCYWPLLRLARRLRLPFGIEATAATLEAIAALDAGWLAELRALLAEGICEFVGSGAVQLIGPLVPPAVNAANQRLGLAAYQRLLGSRPRLALVNEQAYSAGLVRHYLDAGYAGIVIEWDNAAAAHPEWPGGLRYLPQRALGCDGEQIPLLWNQSIAFQKFQRYAHGELELDEYLDYLRGHAGPPPRAWSLYGNDVEIFDFRPGRYHTEAALGSTSEWTRIEALFAALLAEPGVRLIAPGALLDWLDAPGAGQVLALASAARPVLVKKQEKYNLTRWAVTGRGDLDLNTRCWRLYRRLCAQPGVSEADWRTLCELWSSDYRTHITPTRWAALQRRLEALALEPPAEPAAGASVPAALPAETPAHRIEQHGRWLDIDSATLRLRLNLRRGLAIDALSFRQVDEAPLLGTLAHGYYDDIRRGADFYSGHLLLELPGHPKLTDLEAVQPQVRACADGVSIEAAIATPLGPLLKTLHLDLRRGRVQLVYRPQWSGVPKGSLRLGFVTLQPQAFETATLWYATHNGGGRERFALAGAAFDHGRPVSFLVSAGHAFGATEGCVELGDARRVLRVEFDPAQAACIGMLCCEPVGASWFCRLMFSAGEIDDTCRDGLWPTPQLAFTLSAQTLPPAADR